jgi:hypothetical protein
MCFEYDAGYVSFENSCMNSACSTSENS